jgi:hypothetical protein
MNGDLERLLYGHHIISPKERNLYGTEGIANTEIIELKQCIANALWHYLEEADLLEREEYAEVNNA